METIRFTKNQDNKVVNLPTATIKPSIAKLKYISSDKLPSFEDSGVLIFTTDTAELFQGAGRNKPLKPVSSVMVFEDYSLFPTEGIFDKIFVSREENMAYFWDGNEYISLVGGGADGAVTSRIYEYAQRGDFPLEGHSRTLYMDRSKDHVYRYDVATSSYINLTGGMISQEEKERFEQQGEEISTLEGIINALVGKFQGLEDEVKEIEDFDPTFLQNQINDSKMKILALETTGEDTIKVIDDIKEVLDSIKDLNVEQVGIDLASFNERISLVEIKSGEFNSILTSTSNKIDYIEGLGIEQAIAQIMPLTSQITNLTNQSANMNTAIMNLQEEINNIKSIGMDDAKKNIDDLMIAVEALENNQENMDTDLKALESRIRDFDSFDPDSVNQSLGSLESKVEDLEQEKIIVRNQIDQLISSIEDLGGTGLEEISNLIDFISTKVNDLESGKADIQLSIQNILTEIEDIKNGDESDLQDSIVILEGKINSLESDKASLQQEISDLRDIVQDLGAIDLSIVEGKIGSLETETEELKVSKQLISASISSIENRLNELESVDIGNMIDLLVAATLRIDNLETEDLAIKSEMNSIKDLLDSLGNIDIEPIDNEIQAIKVAIQDMQNVAIAGINQEIASMKAQIDSFEKEDLTWLSEELDNINNDITIFKGYDIPSLISELGHIKNQISDIEGIDLTPIIQDIQDIRDTVDAMTIPDIAPINTQISQISDNLAALRDEVENLESTDTEWINTELSNIRDSIDAIVIPQEVDLAPINQDIISLKSRLDVLENTDPVDFGPINQEIELLKIAVEALEGADQVDVEAINQELLDIKDSIAAIEMPDVELINNEISSLKTRIEDIESKDFDSIIAEVERIKTEMIAPMDVVQQDHEIRISALEAQQIAEERVTNLEQALADALERLAKFENSIASIKTIEKIEVEHGSAFDDLNLPSKIEVTLNSGEKIEVDVIWNSNGYDKDLAGTYSIVGTLVLPDGISSNLGTEIKIEITVNEEEEIVYRIITSVRTIDPITVPYNTEESSILMPTSATVDLDDSTTESLAISAWTYQGYDKNVPGTYSAQGELFLLNNVLNPDNFKAEVSITVEEPAIRNIVSISQPVQTEVEFGTDISEIILPSSVNALLDNGATVSVNISQWDTSSYNSNLSGTYTLVGTILPGDYISNSSNFVVNLVVTVEEESSDIEWMYEFEMEGAGAWDFRTHELPGWNPEHWFSLEDFYGEVYDGANKTVELRWIGYRTNRLHDPNGVPMATSVETWTHESPDGKLDYDSDYGIVNFHNASIGIRVYRLIKYKTPFTRP